MKFCIFKDNASKAGEIENAENTTTISGTKFSKEVSVKEEALRRMLSWNMEKIIP
jgi:hypothetical protein